jgi:hypothetical protein
MHGASGITITSILDPPDVAMADEQCKSTSTYSIPDAIHPCNDQYRGSMVGYT